ncbi:MAG: hypothetical protein J6Y12_10325, partial [Lachnospiraceae bacterium]|nr:hypothetical protein [Lachnospiraceae bacterium]
GNDRPLLYYSARILKNSGFDLLKVEFHDMPTDISEDDELKKLAVQLACEQTESSLAGVVFAAYQDIVFVGKSLGTIASAKYVADHGIPARQIWLTPVEKSFSFGSDNVVAFIGDSDLWSDLGKVRRMAERLGVDLSVITGGYNHSLERGSLKSDLKALETVLTKIEEFVRNE